MLADRGGILPSVLVDTGRNRGPALNSSRLILHSLNWLVIMTPHRINNRLVLLAVWEEGISDCVSNGKDCVLLLRSINVVLLDVIVNGGDIQSPAFGRMMIFFGHQQ